MKSIIFLALLFATTNAFAVGGEIVVTGFGGVEQDVDFMKATAGIKSQCYKSPTSVRDANAKLINEIELTMRSMLANNGKDRVYNSQGTTFRETVTQPNPAYYHGSNVPPYIVVCENGWSVQSNVTAEIADIGVWPDFQEKVLLLIEGAVANAGTATSVGTLSSPEGGIYPETEKKMRMTALKRAAADASDQVLELSKACGFTITEFLGTETTENRLLSSEKYVAHAGDSIKLSFAPFVQESSVSFRYKINGGGTCVANLFSDNIYYP